MSLVEMNGLVEMAFGRQTFVGGMNHVLETGAHCHDIVNTVE